MICHTAMPTLDAEIGQMRTFAHKILVLSLKQLFMGFQNWVLSTLLVAVAKSCECLKNAQKSARFVLYVGYNFCQLSSALFQSLFCRCSTYLDALKLLPIYMSRFKYVVLAHNCLIGQLLKCHIAQPLCKPRNYAGSFVASTNTVYTGKK